MKGYVLGVAVEADLNAIWEYIAADNVDAADRWIDKLFEAFDQLSRMPGIGHRREDLTRLPVLFWAVETYLIIYRIQTDGRVQEDGIEIVAVTEGSRDIPSFLIRRNG